MNTQLNKLDENKIKAITNATPTAEIVMTHLGLRQRLRNFTDINRTKYELMKQGENIVNYDYLQLWKSLEAAKAGSIVYGTKGRPDKFMWEYSLKEVARMGLEDYKPLNIGKVTLRKIRPIESSISIVDKPTSLEINLQPVKLFVSIRGKMIKIDLPSDITHEEAELIADSIKQIA